MGFALGMAKGGGKMAGMAGGLSKTGPMAAGMKEKGKTLTNKMKKAAADVGTNASGFALGLPGPGGPDQGMMGMLGGQGPLKSLANQPMGGLPLGSEMFSSPLRELTADPTQGWQGTPFKMPEEQPVASNLNSTRMSKGKAGNKSWTQGDIPQGGTPPRKAPLDADSSAVSGQYMTQQSAQQSPLMQLLTQFSGGPMIQDTWSGPRQQDYTYGNVPQAYWG